jgi:hypothetical protein
LKHHFHFRILRVARETVGDFAASKELEEPICPSNSLKTRES